ncbi:transcriptional regulator, GntR family [Cryobacterium psychrotolerans]|uniref:Transcriptional regulator, GntR family n=1 Tax=Cryobacterium psychrotolerans TaxID=386301 RepID=A0A1G9HLL0_9MICO|nr:MULTISPECIES: FCD domain-containing protein [Cryobacterium]TFD46496.1 FadR family transcriptional regulator [Cryobacterium sp. TMT1-2-1]TFD84482.1 FadR family transcriptional regulator [Cryobacterium psychrotolerans]SDL13666.1 transcriptional regulator, GntR family [Cryobacterium psychrotolerans]
MQEPAGLDGGLLLRPVAGGNAFEETVQRLLQTVRLGLIAPGERLPPERELSAMLAVSRATLRDAIASLADAGYLVSRRGRYGGTFVSDELPVPTPGTDGDGAFRPGREISPAEIEDTLTLREILEVGAARHAAGRPLSPGERELLWASLTEAKAAAGENYRRLDSRFHLTIGELAGSASLMPLIADVRMRVNELLDNIPSLGPNIAHSNAQHEQIAIAILTGRPEAAAQAMSEHLDGTALLLRGFLE